MNIKQGIFSVVVFAIFHAGCWWIFQSGTEQEKVGAAVLVAVVDALVALVVTINLYVWLGKS